MWPVAWSGDGRPCRRGPVGPGSAAACEQKEETGGWTIERVRQSAVGQRWKGGSRGDATPRTSLRRGSPRPLGLGRQKHQTAINTTPFCTLHPLPRRIFLRRGESNQHGLDYGEDVAGSMG